MVIDHHNTACFYKNGKFQSIRFPEKIARISDVILLENGTLALEGSKSSAEYEERYI